MKPGSAGAGKLLWAGLLRLLIVMAAALPFSQPSLAGTTEEPEPVRALHLVLRAVSVADAKARIDLAASAGYNVLVLALADGVAFEHVPGRVRDDAWTVSELLGVVEYARQRGLSVVPEIKFLTHQEKFFQDTHPELMFNTLTSDPRLEAVQALQRAYLDEVIGALQPRAVHIGHDELAGASKRTAAELRKQGHASLPADLFVHSVLSLHRDLSARGLEVWMWGDMLAAPEEFPEMAKPYFHGTLPGYGKSLRDRLPRDIVICDWRYVDEQTEFPTVTVLRQEGFHVLGATWKRAETTRNFAAYAAAHGAQGMIATTWFHVQRKEWEVVDQIIRESGAAFLANFPDRTN